MCLFSTDARESLAEQSPALEALYELMELIIPAAQDYLSLLRVSLIVLASYMISVIVCLFSGISVLRPCPEELHMSCRSAVALSCLLLMCFCLALLLLEVSLLPQYTAFAAMLIDNLDIGSLTFENITILAGYGVFCATLSGTVE